MHFVIGSNTCIRLHDPSQNTVSEHMSSLPASASYNKNPPPGFVRKGDAFHKIRLFARRKRLLDIVEDILHILQTDRQTDQTRIDASRHKLLIGELTVGHAGRMQNAGTDVSHMHLTGP